MTLKLKFLKKQQIKNPVLIEGLPGIGNVGKVAVDFIIDKLKAKKFCDINSYSFPHSVFVNQSNIVELPTISLYYKKHKNKDFIFMAGDIQPIDEQSCYEFCEKFLDLFESYKGKEIITLGGIGLPEIPKKPRIYFTGNSKEIVNNYKKRLKHTEGLFGVVGPIIGVSGLLVGLAKQRKIPAVCILAETFGHPNHLGIRGARELIKSLDKLFSLKLNFKKLDKEIDEIEKDILSKTSQFEDLLKKKIKETEGSEEKRYIG
ncbi:MAG: PAC2 family protein [Candidatus Woesearchaeota archaeon]|nr:MAG: PAC2 family protein [Candidatus Woesearchaeota archaeon]